MALQALQAAMATFPLPMAHTSLLLQEPLVQVVKVVPAVVAAAAAKAIMTIQNVLHSTKKLIV